MASTKKTGDFPTSSEGVPYGHYGNGSPLPPFPDQDPPWHATPVPEERADEDMLRAQSGTKDRLEEMQKPANKHGKGKDAKFAAVTSQTAPDGPLRDEDEDGNVREIDTKEQQ